MSAETILLCIYFISFALVFWMELRREGCLWRTVADDTPDRPWWMFITGWDFLVALVFALIPVLNSFWVILYAVQGVAELWERAAGELWPED